MQIYILALAIFLIVTIVYFRVANHFNIIDQPNHRSSHTSITIRGGGIIFPIAALFFFFAFGFQYSFFIGGLFAISLISFLDDILTLNNKLRLAVHLLAVALLFYQWDLFHVPWYWLLLAAIFVIGTINAYNFMDGINGITGSYSLVAIASLYYINENVVSFTSSDFLLITGIALVVFNFFNFRKKAKCFAGDVGSVSIAFILVFFIGQLIITTSNIAYVMLLLVYGLDAATTVFFRKIRKENIYQAHRSHFYQYLANQLKFNHLLVSLLYAFVQLLINALIIVLVKDDQVMALTLFLSSLIVFMVIRFSVEGRIYLLQPREDINKK